MAWLVANVGRDGMALTSRLSTWLWDERGPALWGPSRACDRCDGGSRNGPRVAEKPRGRGGAEWLHTG